MSIELVDVSVRFGALAAISTINLRIAPSEQVAIIGPSGAGKTSLLRVLCAAQRPTDGSVHLLGEQPWALSRRALRRLRARIGLMQQFPALAPRQRVITAVLAAHLPHWPWWKALASLIVPREANSAAQVLERLELGDRLYDRCDRLSGGQRQRVGLARLLLSKAELLLVDEPISSLDPQLSQRAINELQQEASQRGATLVASLHAVDVALRCFPRIVGLRAGQVAFDLPANEVTEQQLRELYASERLASSDFSPAAEVQLTRSACY